MGDLRPELGVIGVGGRIIFDYQVRAMVRKDSKGKGTVSNKPTRHVYLRQ
jgi:hypothetical protein